jgi:hypothetical protein
MPDLLSRLFRRATPTVADLTCYTRAGCCLCDQARTALTRLAARGLATVTYVDIDIDAALVARYGTRVPVVCRGDEVLAEGKVSEVRLARALMARPAPDTGA